MVKYATPFLLIALSVEQFMKSHRPALIALVCTLLLWSSTYAAIKMALNDYTPLDLATLRFIFASLSLGVFAAFRGLRLPALRDIPFFVALALTGFIGYQLLLNYGELSTSAGISGFMVSLTPIFTLLLSSIFFKEKITWFKSIGTIIALTGVWLISENPHGHATFNLGICLLVLAALSLSSFFILQKSATRRYTSLETTCYAVWIATIIFIAINTPKTTIQAVIDHHGQSLWLAAYLGILCTSIAYWLWAYTLSQIEVSKASIGTYTVPFISALISYYLIQEQYSVNFLLGGVCIIIGVLIATVLRGPINFKSLPDLGKQGVE